MTGEKWSSESVHLLAVDDQESAYILKNNRSLIKVNNNSEQFYSYDLHWPMTTYGLQNELRFFAFNSDYQQMVILDRYLNEITNLDFTSHFNYHIPNAALGNNQTIWLYNPQERKIQCWTMTFEKLVESQNLDFLIPGLHIDQLTIVNNILYLVDKNLGVFGFDSTGQMIIKKRIKDIALPMQFDSNNLGYFQNEKKWFILELDKNNAEIFTVEINQSIPEEMVDIFIFKDGKVYYLKDSEGFNLIVEDYSKLK
ncbi:hypothetical protein GCM10025777_24530 [Membranihabitans marinus]